AGRAAAIQVGRGLEQLHRHAVDLARRNASALAASKGSESPSRSERVHQPEARVMPRRRVLRTRIPEADHGAQASALFAALGLLGLLGFLSLGGLRFSLALRRLAFLALTRLADQLGLGDLRRGLRPRPQPLLGAGR